MRKQTRRRSKVLPRVWHSSTTHSYGHAAKTSGATSKEKPFSLRRRHPHRYLSHRRGWISHSTCASSASELQPVKRSLGAQRGLVKVGCRRGSCQRDRHVEGPSRKPTSYG